MTDSSSKLMIPQGDGWDSVPSEPERFTKGRTIKFREGAYFINRNEPILADELKLLVIGVIVAWVRWGGTARGSSNAGSIRSNQEVQMQMIEFWIVRKGEDAWKVAPEVGDAISEHPDNKKCLFCGDGHEIGAVTAFCWREPDAHIYTAGICVDCAGHSDEKLAEMTQQEVFPDRVAEVRSIREAFDELEAMGLVETVGIDPVTGLKRRQLTAKGREQADLEAQAKHRSKH